MNKEKKIKYCSDCGAKIDLEAEFCPKCGANVKDVSIRQRPPAEKISNGWYCLPLFFGIIGGLIAWVVNRDENPKKAKSFLIFGIIWSLVIPFLIILPTIVLVSLGTVRENARDIRRTADLRQMALALEMYYDDNEQYPGTPNTEAWSDLSVLTPDYMSTLPIDPIDNIDHQYKYYPDNNNQNYILAADSLENSDSSPLDDDYDYCSVISNITCNCTDPIYCFGP